MKKKILVTGGAGYIGSKISYDLTDLGYNVFIIDNLSTGHKFLVNKKATFYYGDILDFKFVDKILSKNKIDKIIHLAASLSVQESQNNPLKYYQNNVEGTRTLLQAAVKNNLKEIIFSSTCAVYGDVKNNKVKETDDSSVTTFIVRASSTTIITAFLTYVVFFVLQFGLYYNKKNVNS